MLNERLFLLLGIGFGVFLFILFFQPFPPDRFDFNNRLLFTTGFGAIVFVFSMLVWAGFPMIMRKNKFDDSYFLSGSLFKGFIILVLSSVAFTFYLRYVGQVSISFYVVFKIVLICIVPPVIIIVFESFRDLIRQNESLISERKTVQRQIEKFEEDNLNRSIEFFSENRAENFVVRIADLVLIQSADNYIEIIYKEGESLRKRLVRNTLKNAELLIKQYSNFIRCHRAYIVNMHFIDKLNRDFSSHWITVKGYPDKIPVSRQYLVKLREAL